MKETDSAIYQIYKYNINQNWYDTLKKEHNLWMLRVSDFRKEEWVADWVLQGMAGENVKARLLLARLKVLIVMKLWLNTF